MKKVLTLALLGALAVSPAFARMGDQRSSDQSSSQSSSRHASRSGQIDQNTARQVQQQLQSQGYDVGQVDGVWGQKSRQALMNYQRDQNIQATGRPDQQTLAALGVERGGTQQAQTPDQGTRRAQERQGERQQEYQGGGQSGGMNR